jgi:LysM repeat protein
MLDRYACFFLLIGFSLCSQGISSLPPPPPRSSSTEELGATLRQFKHSIADLKHEMQNHEQEIRTFENKLHTQETSFEQFHHQITQEVDSQRDFAKATTLNAENKIQTIDQTVRNLEGMMRSLIADMQQLKIQANESVLSLSKYHQRIFDLEKNAETQEQHIQNFAEALQCVIEAIHVKESAKTALPSTNQENIKIYKVQAGDSLEKIARMHKTTVQILREINQLSNDRIIIGQTLKIPS